MREKVKPFIQTATLSNGLKVCIAPQPHLHNVSVGMFVRAGSLYECERTNGLSHLVEHMLFRGTPNYPTYRDFALAVESLGGHINAWTTHDLVAYFIEAPAESGAGVLRLLLEMFSGPRFEGLEKEREVVLEEVRSDLAEKGHDTNVEDLTRGAAFKGHPFGHKIAGTLKSVGTFSESHLKEHFKTFYGARNMSLVVTGNTYTIDRNLLYTSTLLKGRLRRERKLTLVPVHTESAVNYVSHEGAAQTKVMLGLRVPGRNHQLSHTCLNVLSQVLNGGMGARLEQVVRDTGLAYEAGVGLDVLNELGIMTIYGVTSETKVRTLAISLGRLVSEMGKISSAEFLLAQKQVLWGLDSAQDCSMTYLQQLGGLVNRGLEPDFEFKRQMVQKINKEQVCELARYIASGSVYLTCVGPVSNADKRSIRKALANGKLK
jgi:predicted Zn-dependent peptidase